MTVNAHDTLWVKMNTLAMRLTALGTDALLEGEPAIAAWADKACLELQPFLKNTRRYHHGSQAPFEARTLVP